ncbi:YbgC/FadM family acyl-CoA thioesterase [Entomobacter blattae]|uniref:Acyl-CoA thioesterase YbgC n=1 Tax=Entomobacter blattae TaxID=2762277 RepID=A0A7H1NTE1_9PROT|nr:YbgC/FadM family acyl-CoA thioesterase [Entomobacter blattae]QNT79051.1 Acyl-CoA thioesterase YbgC [Entomobacter blattae]
MAKHSIRIRVYYEDTDAGGVMYHARYLAFAERARTEALRSCQASVLDLAQDYNMCFVVANANISYKRPLKLDDEVTVTTILQEIQGATTVLLQLFTVGALLYASMEVKLACLSTQTMRPVRMPEKWKVALLAISP